MPKHRTHHYAMCIKNRGCVASLEVRKVYPVIEDKTAERHGLVRVIDESGEDYLFPAGYFLPVELPRAANRLFVRKSA